VARFIGDINLFPGIVLDQTDNGRLEVSIFDKKVLARKGAKSFRTGQKVLLLLRPEDLRLSEDTQEGMPFFWGSIMERSYRGSTLDTTIHLDHGPVVRACEFFDEDDPDFDYRVGERVKVSWVQGWEVLLPDEDDAH
jgi:spermidine/putrescine transport system ATP-binding protein